jgi:hypothetical protein
VGIDECMLPVSRKYFTEFAVNMFGTRKVLLQQDMLMDPNLKDRLPTHDPFHIYMIARRPRLAFDPTTLFCDKDIFRGTFTRQVQSTFERHDFEVANLIGRDDLRFDCPYPHTTCELLTPEGVPIAGGKVAFLVGNFGLRFRHLLDLEILYIGQAYGEDGSRVAPERLKSHSTLQHIYSEAIARSPDMDIWIVLWAFEPLMITSMGGFEKTFQTTFDEDDLHREKVMNSTISEQQQINFTEAALIRYFQPPYNVIYKDSFPSPAHTTYAQCYDLDLNGVHVELQTEDIGTRLWSQTVKPQWVHFASFDLHSSEDRKSMFDFS